MMDWIKDRIREKLRDAGWTVRPQSSDAEILALLSELHPVRTQFDLVRIGNNGDGGYLAPNDFQGITACFSPGVSRVAHFEEEIAARGIPCFMADASVDGPPTSSNFFHFQKKFLGLRNDQNTITLKDWVAQCAPDGGDLILQMDIEGAEWNVLLSAPEEILKRFRILIVEFHGLDELIDKVAFRRIRDVFDLILRDFHVVHWHPNNWSQGVKRGQLHLPSLMEATFLRKDRSPATGYVSQFPHPLDSDNVPRHETLVLPAVWHR
jgi:hypothetical protein